MKKILIVIVGLYLSGCASQVLESYVGKPLTEIILDNGPPIGSMDMPDGTRAFQWQERSSRYVPQTTTINSHTYGGLYGTSAYTTHTATTYGGYTVNSDCTYTLFAKRVDKKDDPSSWVITGFRQPRWDCE